MSILNLFSIGIGPSSTQTTGPMVAAYYFREHLIKDGVIGDVCRLKVRLYGSLARTGKKNGADQAVLLGLEGGRPEQVQIEAIPARLAVLRENTILQLGENCLVKFDPTTDLEFRHNEFLPAHPEGLRFVALNHAGLELSRRTYYSVGGGFVVNETFELLNAAARPCALLPFALHTEDAVLRSARESSLTISEMTARNESVFRSGAETRATLLRIWKTMNHCVARGIHSTGGTAGIMAVERRAPQILLQLLRRQSDPTIDPLGWIGLWSTAVNEENATGSRVVAAPTNGAAGVFPAVLHYFECIKGPLSEDAAVRALLTAGAIGQICRRKFAQSVGTGSCQDEINVASAMAAAAFCEALGGSIAQILCAAEIAMDFYPSVDCDPEVGFAQAPCIERNTMGAVKAINAARIAVQTTTIRRGHMGRTVNDMRLAGLPATTKQNVGGRVLPVSAAAC